MKNLDDFQSDEADADFWRVGLLIVKEKGMTIRYIMITGKIILKSTYR